MKFNYWFYLVILVLISFNVYIWQQFSYVKRNLVQIHATLDRMSAHSSRSAEKIKMWIKEYPTMVLTRSYNGFHRGLYDQIQTTESIDNPHPELRRLPDDKLKVSFYIFKNQNLHLAENIPFFYLKKEEQTFSEFDYNKDIFFYCIDKINLLSILLYVTCAIIIGLALKYEGPNMPNPYTLTFKGKILIFLLIYTIAMCLL
jgi:hypothetical protein